MTDILLEQDGSGFWDWVLEDGDLVLSHTVSRSAEVAQRVIYTMQTWYAECPYDRSIGIPYAETVFGEPVPGVVGLLTQRLLDTEGVDSLAESPTFVLDRASRVLTLTLPIHIGDDEITVTLEVPS